MHSHRAAVRPLSLTTKRAHPPSHTVFQTPPLLIHIVSFLPDASLLTCLHISRHWTQTLKQHLPPENLPLPDSPYPYIPRSEQATVHRNPFAVLSSLKAEADAESEPEPEPEPVQLAHAIFYIPELLTTILLHVPALTLLRLQRVSLTWLHTIHASPLLRKTLHLQPDHQRRHNPSHNPSLNPLAHYEPTTRTAVLEPLQPSIIAHLSPFLQLHAHSHAPEMLSIDATGHVSGALAFHRGGAAYKTLLSSCSASFRAQYVSQPPVTSVRVYFSTPRAWQLARKMARAGARGRTVQHNRAALPGAFWDAQCREQYLKVEREGGVRLGDVVDEARGDAAVGVVRAGGVWWRLGSGEVGRGGGGR
ncbi:hypothetical protein BDV95DRAFT_607152 [Massariosphaeria phaeospora]|uniref:Uncharacterized protein n=1 Tax=Massariosphaeria phaeospora TaxID=100035 RepID=A0A7C8MA35_9PLEO|nr:hypothetical protein BDV95DRAFT_607152 [Massariosphaeria phaeospora]